MERICNQGLCFQHHSGLAKMQLRKSYKGGSKHRYVILSEQSVFLSTYYAAFYGIIDV